MREEVSSKINIVIGVAALCILFACGKKQAFERLEGEKLGLNFSNDIEETDGFNIIDYLYFFNGGGVAIGDINNDNLPDVYLSGNQVKNKLYLNKGNLEFQDITESAGVAGESSWNTGVTMADINGDGFLDIYVCAVVGLKGLRGHNELFINNGDGTFSEKSVEYGLDFDSFSSAATFFDYDLDGDLDCFLLNHAIHTQESFGKAELRNERNYETGDKLLRNDNGNFVDVSDSSGIFGGINGYGLGIAIADFNKDNFPDIYVGNDFHEDDYYYLNNGDGTFTDNLRNAVTQTTRFSMGNDVADINHDGLPDLLSLDMLPNDEKVLKRSDGDERLEILKLRTEKYGYYYQFSRNMLQINNGDGTYSETALLNGVAATDWSWSALFADYDQDSHQDLFIANGIPRRPNDLDYIKFVSSDQIKGTIDNSKLVDQQALELMPSGELPNMIFQGDGTGAFDDKTGDWIDNKLSFSTAATFGDLDLDGDLDIVVNNINASPFIYINQSTSKGNYLKIYCKGEKQNTIGLGTKVYAYSNGVLQYQELFTSRGFQSSAEPVLHFGFGSEEDLDSLKVVWPNGNEQLLTSVKLNETIVLDITNSIPVRINLEEETYSSKVFSKIDPLSLGLDFVHEEDDYSDFRRLKLIPYQQSDRGPATAVGDMNGDGKSDLFFGGSKFKTSSLYLQTEEGFKKSTLNLVQNDSINEEVNAVIADFNNDNQMDLLTATGGGDFFGKSKPLLDQAYLSSGDSLVSVALSEIYENNGCIELIDFNGDGMQDVFIGSQSRPNDFGNVPVSALYENKNGKLVNVQADVFKALGMITDAVAVDYNNDQAVDLVVVGEWMEPIFLKNQDGTFMIDKALGNAGNGLWQCIAPIDLENDGDIDFVLGNWGTNSKFKGSPNKPLVMYYGDLDKDGATESIVAIEKSGKYYPIAGLDLLSQQIISLRKKYTSYESFAGKTVDEIFGKQVLADAKKYTVENLQSGYLINNNGRFEFTSFDRNLQVAPLMDLLPYDFDNDGTEEMLISGNYFGVQPYHGRFGSFGGALLEPDLTLSYGKSLGLDLFNRSTRALNVIEIGKDPYLLVTLHDESLQLYKLNKN